MSDSSRAPLQSPSRRDALRRFGTILVAVGGALAALPVLGFVFAPFRRKAADEWVDLGDAAQFPAGQTRLAEYASPIAVPWDGQSQNTACWVRHTPDGEFHVFSVNCAHLGCPVKWFSESKLFMCPCHGGAYYEDGSRASGPPPRGLFRYTHRVVDGRLQILAGRLPTLHEST